MNTDFTFQSLHKTTNDCELRLSPCAETGGRPDIKGVGTVFETNSSDPFSTDSLSLRGIIHGPYCDFSTTLTADFPWVPSRSEGVSATALEATILEPCYWTPWLPMEYEFRMVVQMEGGQEHALTLRTGVKRFYAERSNLTLELKRTVLRGTRMGLPAENDFQAAREHETALLVSCPELKTCERASRWGVPLVVDLRESPRPWEEMCRALDWYPAVMVVLASAEQLAGSQGARPRNSLLGMVCNATDSWDSISLLPFDLLAVELQPSESPPSWSATCGKPVLAIRLGSGQNIAQARRDCDRLQAELAPAFDLAGYFV